MNVIKEVKTNDNKASSARAAKYQEVVVLDAAGKPLEGEVRLKDGTICRFHNGLLDGNVYDKDGKIVSQMPAMEYDYGGTEFCSKGLLDGFPAVVQNFGYLEEDWKEGVIQAIRSESKLSAVK